MSQRIEGKTLTVKFTNEMLLELDRIAERLELKRTDVIRNMISVGFEIFHGYEKIGVVKLYEIKQKAKKLVKDDRQPSLF